MTNPYFEAPERPGDVFINSDKGEKANWVFLAGGITGCPDWQAELRSILDEDSEEHPVVLFNPRRAEFDVTQVHASDVQVEWEYDMLQEVDLISFWFANCDSLQPIALFELGSHINGNIVVGCDPGYIREYDVRKQLQLARLDIQVVSTLADLATQIKGALYEG